MKILFRCVGFQPVVTLYIVVEIVLLCKHLHLISFISSLRNCRYCFVENMLSNGVLHQGMYNVMQEWYNYIRENVHIQADLIGEC